MKKLNKTMIKTLGVVAIVAAVGFIGATNSVEAKTLKANKKYSINIDGKKGKEKIQIKSKKMKNSNFDKFILYINGKKVSQKVGYDVFCNVIDINKKKAGKELVFFGIGNSSVVDKKAGIYTYKKGKLNRILSLYKYDKEMKFYRIALGYDKHITTDGKGNVTIDFDTPSEVGIGCYFTKVQFAYKKGKLVRTTKNEVEFVESSRTYQYELNEDVTVYQKPSQASGVKTVLKKNSKLNILKVRYDVIKDKITDDNREKACYNIYAYVKADNGTTGWIALKTYDYTSKQNQFKEYTEWG